MQQKKKKGNFEVTNFEPVKQETYLGLAYKASLNREEAGGLALLRDG